MKIYNLKHLCFGYVCGGSFMYTLFPPLAICKQKFDVKVLDCFISFVSELEKKKTKKNQKQQNLDLVQKAVRL